MSAPESAPTEVFTCGACKKTFPLVRSEQEAQEEASQLWGSVPGEDPNPDVWATVCDVCFKEFMASMTQGDA
jgi:hypothetical protein